MPPAAAVLTPCASIFRVGLVTDVGRLNSSVDAAGWAGLQAERKRHPCLSIELLQSKFPGDYLANLQTLADRDDLVVAGSFLLTEAVYQAARERPGSRFVLVDPLLAAATPTNLLIAGFREDQAAYLAGALAAMVTRTRILGGVYGLEGGAMTRYRRGFEQGALAIDPSIKLLGVYQAATDGPPFGNPDWGGVQAQQFIRLGADVVFGAGGTTGQGALLATAAANRRCVGAGVDDYLGDLQARSCLLTSAVVHVDVALEAIVEDALAGHWAAGLRSFDVATGGVGLAPFHQYDSAVTPEMRRRLAELAAALAAGTLLERN